MCFGTLPFGCNELTREVLGETEGYRLGGLPDFDGGDGFRVRDVHTRSALSAEHGARMFKHTRDGGKHTGTIGTLHADDLDQRRFLTSWICEI